MTSPEDIKKFREERRKAFDGPCSKCGSAPVHIVFTDHSLCTECYLKALKKARLELPKNVRGSKIGEGNED